MDSSYSPKPWHMLMPLAMFALGTQAMLSSDWRLFGMAAFGAGIITAIWIGLAGMIEVRMNYIMFMKDQQTETPGPVAIKKEFGVTHIKLDTSEGEAQFQMKYIKLPIPEDKLRLLAQGLFNGLPFSERQWAGFGKPFSSPEFRELRAEMIKRGLLVPKNSKGERQGFELNVAGRAVMKHYLPSPTPQEMAA